MAIDFLSLAHQNIKHIIPYEPGGHIDTLRGKIKRDDIIKLASNENPLGVSEKVTAALTNLEKIIPFYPDSHATKLKEALSSFYDIPKENLFIGNGSEEIIRLLTMAFNRPDKQIIFPQYAFISYKLNCQSLNTHFNEIPSPDYKINPQWLIDSSQENTSLIFLANPNNPTGDYITQDTLETMLSSIPSTTLLVLDEAYYEYAKHLDDYPDTQALQTRYPNLVILRTFSKVYGLAGLRVGYCIAHPGLIDVLNRISLPFNVSNVSELAATIALSDQSFVEKSLDNNKKGMYALEEAITALGFDYISSSTNFLTIDFKKEAKPLSDALQQDGIMVRTLYPYGMPTFIRVSIGLPDQNQYLIEQLRLRS